MVAQNRTIFDRAMADAVVKGLSGKNKTLPSWLFYDAEGDNIFRQIMRMPEYYPTRCEYDILKQSKNDLLDNFRAGAPTFRLLELGAGDGLKTEILLGYFLEQNVNFTYVPIDISPNALDLLTGRLSNIFPQLRIEAINKSYEAALTDLSKVREKKVILFMGANIGNFTQQDAVQFLKNLSGHLSENDLMLIGFDLRKHPRIIMEAYDDKRGLTAAFNLNILRRLNRELGADFDVRNFSHYPFYDPATGATKSFLISLTEQTVYIAAVETSIRLKAWEPIQTEVSQKYDTDMIEDVLARSGLRMVRTFSDGDHYFCDVLVRAR